MNIYLDIDGVLLANDKQPALHAEEFVRYLVEHHTVFWLTTHCRHPDDDPVLLLERFFSGPVIEYFRKITPAYWDTLKTEAIDFSQPFYWIDDDCLAVEQEILRERGVFDSWIRVDLARDPDQLQRLVVL